MRLALLFVAFLTCAVPAFGQASPVSAPAADAIAQAPAKTIELSSPDRQIEKRLNGLFGELDGLEQVKADVRAGVVTLTGRTLTGDERQKAEGVATRLSGVVSVDNQIEIERNVGRRIQPMVESANQLWRDTLAFAPLLAFAVLIFLVVWAIGRLLTGSNAVFRRIAPNPLVQTLVAQVVRLGFLVLGLIVALRILGASAVLGSLLGAAGVVGLAVGFAVRDTIENYIASILLSIRRPFAPNDQVIIEDFEGRVTRLNSRATFLTSLDGNELRIPNAIVYKAKITNFTQIPERRFEFTIGIGPENELCSALAVALAAVKDSAGVLREPEPSVIIDKLDDSRVTIRVFAWIDQRESDFLKARSNAIRVVKDALEANDVSMPAPIQNISIVDSDQAQPKRRPPASAEEVREVSDTRPDRSIEQKVASIRSHSEEDLLAQAGPKE